MCVDQFNCYTCCNRSHTIQHALIAHKITV